ncbi:MAG TPA: VWA-like domain-containing protein [Solirubrobacteraceae bacterium]|nr:VWA-like domain-containing protein [Solirubrobacteraceae bacterium]
MANKVYDNLAAGRLISRRKAPYFGSMITSLVPHEMKGLETIGVTKNAVLVYDPEWIALRTQDEMGGLYWHETMHLVLDHHGRRGDKHPFLWNVAGDVFINDQGRNAGFTFPPGGLYPETFGFPKNLTTEEYYALLLKMAEEAVKDATGKAQAKAGSWKSGACGSGAGNPMEGEPDGSGEGEGDGEAVPGRSESEVAQTRLRVAESVKEHAKQSKGRGNLPLGIDRWADEMCRPPVVPWQAILGRVVRQAVAFRPGAVDYTYQRPSRRQGGVGFGVGRPILPALVRPVPRVAFILDTSGSMGTEQLAAGIAEACGVLKACGAEITFMSCDHEVHAIGKVENPAQLSKLVKGGGGSSFVPAFEALARTRPACQLAVFATDGDISVPAHAPKNMRVVWLLIDAYRGKPCEWGDKVVISSRGEVEEQDA